MHLAKRFDSVICFEPIARLRECWNKNLSDMDGVVELHACALGREAGTVTMLSNQYASGDSYLSDATEKRNIGGHVAELADTVEMHTLDSFEFTDVDLIKCDAEGYEENILRGAEETIRKWRPTIIVEQKREMARKFGLEPKGAVEYLKARSYVVAREMAGDFIMVYR
jgi:FkbM family methyltransferase